ncbi:murein transglycosylase A family protein [Thermocoleostomius sinensis]|uniref:POLO box domain-containing protein n=1 Tax=Thermocoleostomius sinensis A174 TaxID=2016057 RepID=A0A9E8ZCE6_9CYAN|nr:hypothetical protein [Thermocoleostomius sinensis]WAL60307.1 hypothetical protein OXH18_24605 [Thermocoleostomius sinensis A174]
MLNRVGLFYFFCALLISLAIGGSPLAHQTPTSSWPNPNEVTVSTASTASAVATTPAVYQAIDEYHRPRFSVDGHQVMRTGRLPRVELRFNETDLLTVLQNTQAYFQTYGEENAEVQREGILGAQGVTIADVLDTLEFMIATLQEDLRHQQPTRLKDPNFINTHFRVIEWSAYDPANLREKQVRLTKYAVFTHPGSRSPTAVFTVPLYQLPDDAETDRFYLNYTKQEVLAGIYEPGGAEFGRVEPLAYLTRDSFEDALMQGTVLVNFTDGSSAFFNVDRNNGIAYDTNISPYRQGRYWYFKPVDAIKGYGHTSEAKISIKPGVTFAGDVLNIGLGRIVVLAAPSGTAQLGVIADTGGAFLPNLHQLDFLAGVFRDRDEFYTHISQLPEYANAYILIRKP